MKFDQNTMFFALLLLAIWLLFFRQPRSEKYCGACGAVA
jgi:hypothetical protein